MNPVRRFFRRYVFSTVGLLALLLVTNIAVLVILLGIGEMTGPSDSFQIVDFCAHLTGSGSGWQADRTAVGMLDQNRAWAMILDPAGQVAWEYQLPPKGSMAKYYVSLDRDYYDFLTVLACAIFYANVLLVVVLFIHSARRVEKAMGPILNAIRSLADGKPVRLREDGELAEINASLNRAAAYITRKDNTRAEWIRGISHDIRTPLSVILGYASELEESGELPPWARDQAGAIRRQSEKLTGLVADLNLTTRLEYALRPIDRKKLDGVEIARQAVTEVLNDGLADCYSLTFTEAEPGRHLPVAGDPALLDRMLSNLLRNCIRHNPGGCQMTVTVAPAPAGGCIFVIADDGCGVSPSQLRTLNRGAPLASTQPSDPAGVAEHGLGLRIVRQIVRAHRGRLAFANTVPHGLTVTIWIGEP